MFNSDLILDQANVKHNTQTNNNTSPNSQATLLLSQQQQQQFTSLLAAAVNSNQNGSNTSNLAHLNGLNLLSSDILDKKVYKKLPTLV